MVYQQKHLVKRNLSSSIKILAIIMFLAVGGAAMFGLIDMKDGTNAPFLSHFYEGGLFPNGVTALLITMITVNFSFQVQN